MGTIENDRAEEVGEVGITLRDFLLYSAVHPRDWYFGNDTDGTYMYIMQLVIMQIPK